MPKSAANSTRISRGGTSLVLALLLGSSAVAHEPYDIPLDSAYSATHWSTREGLPQNSVMDILQTPDGFLWLATLGGLVRFDGRQFDNLDIVDDFNPGSNRIHILSSDHRGGFWVLSDRPGVVHFQQGDFQRQLVSTRFLMIVGARDGGLWLFNREGVWKYAQGELELRVPGAEIQPRGDTRYALFEDSRGRLFIAGSDRALARLDATGLQLTRAPMDINCFAEDSRGTIWAGGIGGLLRVTDSLQVEILQAGTAVTGLDVDAQDQLWAAGSDGVWRWGTEGAHAVYRPDERELRPELVRKIFIDQEQNVWIGHDSRGLMRLRPSALRGYSVAQGLSERGVSAVCEDERGVLLIGNRQHLLQLIGDRFERLADPIWEQTVGDVTMMVPARAGGIWIGKGKFLLRRSGGRMELSREVEQPIYSLLEFEDGRLWLGTELGLLELDGSVERRIEELHGATVRCIHRARDGKIWLGTSIGLFRHDAGGFQRIDRQSGLAVGEVRDILELTDGTLWFASYGGGLSRYRAGEFRSVTTAHGLADNAISRLILHGDKRLYMNTNRGAFRVQLDQLDAVASGNAARITSIPLGPAWQLYTDEAQGGNMGAGTQRSDGTIWFPSIDGLIRLDPQHDSVNAHPPRPVILRIHNGTEHLPAEEEIQLARGRRALSIEYTAPSFRHPDLTRFQYRLEGLNEDWVDAGASLAANYANLPPGHYRFVLDATNEDGVTSSQSASVRFHVPAHYYETLWFRLSMLGVLILVILLAVQARTRRVSRRAEELEAQVRMRTFELERSRLELEDRVSERTQQLERASEARHADLLERQKLQEQLWNVQKLESVGRLAGGMAHDFNNILTVILGQAGLARIQSEEPEAVRESMDAVIDAGARASNLTRQLLTFARGGTPSLRPIDLGKTLLGLGDMVRHILGDQIQVELRVPSDLGWVNADPTQIEQVMVNLCVNARDAMPHGGLFRIEASDRELREGDRSEQWIHVAVSDSGVGMDAETLERIFEPFFTTKDSATGTGLGLAVCHGILSKSGGRISARSELGRGTTVELLLPAIEAIPVTAANDRPREERLQELTVLVVDDRENVRDVTRAMLTTLGCKVHSADGPQQALEIADRLGSQIDILLSDVMMPEMRGDECAARIRERHPSLEVILMSGYADHLDLEELGLAESVTLLAKPFTLEELRSALVRARVGARG